MLAEVCHFMTNIDMFQMVVVFKTQYLAVARILHARNLPCLIMKQYSTHLPPLNEQENW